MKKNVENQLSTLLLYHISKNPHPWKVRIFQWFQRFSKKV
nr:MAG TPA: hypothetical protein [Caudoviricetes sp.]